MTRTMTIGVKVSTFANKFIVLNNSSQYSTTSFVIPPFL